MCHWIAHLNSIPCDYSFVNDFIRMHSRAYTCTYFHGDASRTTKLTRLTASPCTAKLSHHNTLRHTVLHTHAHTHIHPHRCQNQERRISITLRSTEGELGDLIVTVVANLVTDKVAKVSAMFWTHLLPFHSVLLRGWEWDSGFLISYIWSYLFYLVFTTLHPPTLQHHSSQPYHSPSLNPCRTYTYVRFISCHAMSVG